MKTKNIYGFVAGLLLILSGCATAHIEKDKTTDFTRYKTFAWENNSHKSLTLTEQKIREEVTAELEKNAGWRQVTTHPDILLSYDVLVEKSTKTNQSPVYTRPYSRIVYNPYRKHYTTIYFPSQLVGYDRETYPVKEGTITISMIDTQTDKMVWQGWTTEEMDSKHLTSAEIENSVRALFRKFDVAKN